MLASLIYKKWKLIPKCEIIYEIFCQEKNETNAFKYQLVRQQKRILFKAQTAAERIKILAAEIF